MRSRFTVLLVLPLATLAALYAVHPVTALTDGPTRKTLEANAFSERLIRASIYAKDSREYFNEEKRRFVHGIPRVQEPLIYEPDVYTWELAMATQRRQIAAMNPPMAPIPGVVQPIPMEPTIAPPMAPDQVQLTPLGTAGLPSYAPMVNPDVRMDSMLARARASGIRPDGQLRALEIKQKLLNHMNGVQQQGPALPILAPQAPRGQAGDSYDDKY